MPPTNTCYSILRESQPPHILREADALSPEDLKGMVGQTVVFHVHASDAAGIAKIAQCKKRISEQVEVAAGVYATVLGESEAATDHAYLQTGRPVRATNYLVRIDDVHTESLQTHNFLRDDKKSVRFRSARR